MSAKTGRAPRRANAFAVETKVKEGTMNSSPVYVQQKSGHFQSVVHEVVSRPWGRRAPLPEAHDFLVKAPSPEICAPRSPLVCIPSPAQAGRFIERDSGNGSSPGGAVRSERNLAPGPIQSPESMIVGDQEIPPAWAGRQLDSRMDSSV